MNRAATILTALLLSLTACSSSTPGGAAATPTHSAKDTAFLASIRDSISGGSDDDLITQAKAACKRLNDGTDTLQVASDLVDQGWTTGDASALVAAARRVYCP